jgi:hypothetical protein
MGEVLKDGRPRTIEEFAALPEYGFGQRVFDISAEDKANGYITVDDRRVYISGPAEPSPHFVSHLLGDLEGYVDADGVSWALTLRADGKWFRARV